MNLYHVECAEVTCLNVFAIDKERAGALAKIYLEFNFAEGVKYTVSDVIDPMQLDRRSREFLMGALARNAEGSRRVRGRQGLADLSNMELSVPNQVRIAARLRRATSSI